METSTSVFARTDRVFAGFLLRLAVLYAFAADLTVGSSVCAAENRAANVPAPAVAAPKAAVKKSRICKFENCTRYVVNRGLCIGHGVSFWTVVALLVLWDRTDE